MAIAVWSVKGGVGVTSVAAMLAIAQAERAEPAVLIDLCGDMPALLGISESDDTPASPGIAEWCAAGEPTTEALARIEQHVRTDVTLIPRGTGSLASDAALLVRAINESHQGVIIDCGLVSAEDGFVSEVVASAATSLLVVRECFLNLRAAQRCPLTPTGVIVVHERGRHLGRPDVEAVTGAPVVAQIAVDARIARSLDAGLATARLPRTLLRSLARVITDG